jgi:hypothetical protein
MLCLLKYNGFKTHRVVRPQAQFPGNSIVIQHHIIWGLCMFGQGQAGDVIDRHYEWPARPRGSALGGHCQAHGVIW